MLYRGKGLSGLEEAMKECFNDESNYYNNIINDLYKSFTGLAYTPLSCVPVFAFLKRYSPFAPDFTIILLHICHMVFIRRATIIYVAIFMLFAAPAAHAQVIPQWVAPPEATALINPMANYKETLANAHMLYNNLCAQCHGYKGKGDGPVAALLNPHPADHTSSSIQAETDGALFWKIKTGRGQMQPYAEKLTDQQRWSLVNYIRTLKK